MAGYMEWSHSSVVICGRTEIFKKKIVAVNLKKLIDRASRKQQNLDFSLPCACTVSGSSYNTSLKLFKKAFAILKSKTS